MPIALALQAVAVPHESVPLPLSAFMAWALPRMLPAVAVAVAVAVEPPFAPEAVVADEVQPVAVTI